MDNKIVRLRISIQNALIGRITSEVRGVYVKIDKNCIDIYVVIDGKFSCYWNEVIYEIGTDVIADFDDTYIINENLVRLDYPENLFFEDCICVYRRFENIS